MYRLLFVKQLIVVNLLSSLCVAQVYLEIGDSLILNYEQKIVKMAEKVGMQIEKTDNDTYKLYTNDKFLDGRWKLIVLPNNHDGNNGFLLWEVSPSGKKDTAFTTCLYARALKEEFVGPDKSYKSIAFKQPFIAYSLSLIVPPAGAYYAGDSPVFGPGVKWLQCGFVFLLEGLSWILLFDNSLSPQIRGAAPYGLILSRLLAISASKHAILITTYWHNSGYKVY